MMPLLMGLDSLWRQLESLERDHRAEAWQRPGFTYYGNFDDQQARTGRVERVRSALFFSGVEAGHIVAERLAGINLSSVMNILLDACRDVAAYWGGSVLAGGALGGAIGAFGGGVGALPGAAIGAGLGSQVGAWVLGILGLKALLEDLGNALPEALGHYGNGIRMAWGPVRHWESADSVFMDHASREIARGHVVLMMALLGALSAYLTRGRGDPAARTRLLQEIRESPRLGPKVADWVAANEESLARHPGLKPKEQQVVMMSQAKPPAGPPMTPSQLRRAAGNTAEAENNGSGTVRGSTANAAAGPGFDTSNLQSKLQGYLLDPAHPQNQAKAVWFDKALGFNKENWQDLASQIKFDKATAIQTKVTQYGTTYEQVIPIVGKNGNVINATFVFMKDVNEVIRLVTGIPTPRQP
jgi:hypothetical protein